MGNGAGCGKSAQVVPASAVAQRYVDVHGLVSNSKSERFPAPAFAEGAPEGGDCLLLLQQIRGARGHPRLRARVARTRLQSGGVPGETAPEEEGDWGSRVAKWPPKFSAGVVSWNSAQPLGLPVGARGEYILHLEVWDEKAMLGCWAEPLGDVPVHEAVTRELLLRAASRRITIKSVGAGSPITVSFQILNSQAVAHKRTVFFVRHAESVWNDAQSKKHFHKMAQQKDHPLSAKGRHQAEALAARLTAAAKPAGDAAAAPMLRPDVVLVSPLTRAVQTAVIALGPSLTQPGGLGEVVLMANAREKLNWGSMDTVSTKVGVRILSAALHKLRILYRGKGDEIIDTFAKLRYDLHEVEEEQWWTEGTSESPSQVQVRLQEFMAQLLYSPHRCIVVVGHSHFFRAAFGRFLAEEFKEQEPLLAHSLATMKLMNCGVIRAELDPGRGVDGGPIVSAEAVLGTEFLKGSVASLALQGM